MEIPVETEMSRKHVLYQKAIRALNLTTSGVNFEEKDAETLAGPVKKGFYFLTDGEPMSDSQIAEVEAKYLEIKADRDMGAQEYVRNRVAEYPSGGDQLDMIYKDNLNSTTTHKDAVEAVKTKWPKDNSGPVE